MSYNIFFSHGTADSAIAKSFKDKIEEMNIGTYLYEYDLQPGRYVASKLQTAIDSRDVLLVLLTKQSQYSPYLHQEIGYAEAKGKLIIPLVEPGIDRHVLAMLEGREYIPFEYDNTERVAANVQALLYRKKMDKDNKEMLILGGVAILLIVVLIAVAYASPEEQYI